MSCDTTSEDIEDEISSWGYSVTFSDFERSRQSEKHIQLNKIGSVAGRGRGISNNNYMATVKLASEINELKANVVPMGHLPTSSEILGAPSENEITPLLRKLGISGHDGEISSRNTRQVPLHQEQIRLDGNIPVILDGELFNTLNETASSGARLSADDEPFDPNRPLQEQFKTIKEFLMDECVKPPSVIDQNPVLGSVSACPKSSIPSPSSVSIDLSSHSSPANDDSSTSTSVTTYSTGEQYSNEQWCEEPLLKRKNKLYTPRQLYEIKKIHPIKCIPKAS
ncbi:uncharacterized protein LOC131681631 isoform X1 [Topomyia yanbarensis]|uniref:uncharacterized protein LOC131681631 isoform X1 n=1 Tax=Topomyia yanbarensis TaxID=2498891 RepID=UPI00273B6FFD|nr:uncharacterized protein LOC131681631 isoform X1 [Topomyia yanbarensis]